MQKGLKEKFSCTRCEFISLEGTKSIDGKIVTTISFDALEDGVETLVIPKSVTSIKGELYSNRYDLTVLIGMLIAFVGTAFAVAVQNHGGKGDFLYQSNVTDRRALALS